MQKVKYKGKEYSSIASACASLGIAIISVYRYIQKGITAEQAIEQILKNKKRNSCTDHLGNEFESIRTMAEFYHIPYNTLYNRLKRKWSLKRALTTPKKENMQVTYKGKKYRSTSLACDLLGISPVTVCANYKGVPVEQAFDKILENKRKNNCTDHLGYGFESKRAMAKFYNIPYETLLFRLKSHWDLERALTTPKKRYNKRKNRQCKNY